FDDYRLDGSRERWDAFDFPSETLTDLLALGRSLVLTTPLSALALFPLTHMADVSKSEEPGSETETARLVAGRLGLAFDDGFVLPIWPSRLRVSVALLLCPFSHPPSAK